MNSKNQIRKKVLEKRRNLANKFVKSASESINVQLIEYFKNSNFKNIMIYASFDNEPETLLIRQYFERHGVLVAYPFIKNDTLVPKIPSRSMKKGTFGILEPDEEDKSIRPADLELVIVPGIAFDKRKNRIGYGKGYYDKLLFQTNALRTALAYSFQITEENIEPDYYDIPMDLIITENGKIL